MASLVGLAFLSPFIAGPSFAHTPTALSAQNPTVCVASGASTLTVLYNAVGPSDRDWSVRTRLGLSGGDAVQLTLFAFYLFDNSWSTTEPMASWGDVAGNFIYNPGFSHQGTLSVHAGGTMTTWNTVENRGSGSQCYSVWAQAFHSLD